MPLQVKRMIQSIKGTRSLIYATQDQRDVIILFGKIFLNILKVAHKNLKIIKVLMSVGIDQASLA